MTVKIIAEAGVNHNGSFNTALKLIDAAYDAGADVVKFQTFKAKNLTSKVALQADYQIKNIGMDTSQFEMLSKLELPYGMHTGLIEHCNKRGIEFLSTAFDSESLNFLTQDLRLNILKIPSGELTNAPFILEHAQKGCDLIVSTGMATLAEIETALGIIAFGFISSVSTNPSEFAFAEAYSSKEGQKALKKKVTLLHCTTEYPAPMNEINLRAMQTMETAFGLPVGYSDHSLGITVPIIATAMGARVIEKHFTLDKNMPGPDHLASLEPDELTNMVQAVRDVEFVLGGNIKAPQPSEIKNKSIIRKSLVVTKDIKKGEIFHKDNLAVKRPGYGLAPIKYWQLLGSTAIRDYKEDEVLDIETSKKL